MMVVVMMMVSVVVMVMVVSVVVMSVVMVSMMVVSVVEMVAEKEGERRLLASEEGVEESVSFRHRNDHCKKE